MNPTKFYVHHTGEEKVLFESLDDCKNYIKQHPNYKTSYFTKKGLATSKNPIQKESFRITDNMGGMWFIK